MNPAPPRSLRSLPPEGASAPPGGRAAPGFQFPVRVYWEDTDTCVLRAWICQQRGVSHGHATFRC
jgi:hypothetical protein